MSLPDGFTLHDAHLGAAAQAAMAEDLRAVAEAAPMFHPETRWGKQMSVRMTSAGRVGWFSDRRGYRYEPRHPNGRPSPPVCSLSGAASADGTPTLTAA